MSIITKPQSIQKGSPATFSLSKVDLASHPLVVADDYFNDAQNWSKIIITYKSTVGSQYELVEFDATSPAPEGVFLASDKARDSFQVQHIEIVDFDGGIFTINRSALTVADFDLTFV
jgi:hypothetical protein